jgi:hypothetical protein
MITKTTINIVTLYDLFINNIILLISLVYYFIVFYSNSNDITIIDKFLSTINIQQLKWFETLRLTINISQNIHLLEIIVLFCRYKFIFDNNENDVNNNISFIILNWIINNTLLSSVNVYYLFYDTNYRTNLSTTESEFISFLNTNCNKITNSCFYLNTIVFKNNIFTIIFTIFPLIIIVFITWLIFWHIVYILTCILVDWCKKYKIKIINKKEVNENDKV